jgi:NADH:ubiquinone oxidoreductase subunit F (NADH-binding)/NADH:ubiquinone oxidoreductase subunit E
MPTATIRRHSRLQPKGRTVDPGVRDRVANLLTGLPLRRDLLIEHLHRLQDANRCLRKAELVALADLLKLSPVEVFEVATFYHHFDVLEDGDPQPPTHAVRVCTSIACAMAGSTSLLAAARVLPDARVLPASCIGRCGHAPAALVDGAAIAPASVDGIRAELQNPGEGNAAPSVDYAAYRAQGGYRLLARATAGEPTRDAVIARLEDARLRGLGGAGFPTGRKWRAVRDEPKPRLVAINIDEGEPGTFKDRWLLERDPHRAIEGMLLAAWAVEADEIYVYLRDEYAGCRTMLAHELARLAADPPCPRPAIHLRRGAGAYICGEESAMIESIEGRRGLPRLRPPYVAQRGLFGRPTLEQNLETVFWVRAILEHGPHGFASQGRRGHAGVRAFSVSGRVRNPGVYVAPQGITARELIDEFAGGMADGHALYAFLPGGASGGILPASLADVPLAFGTLEPHGAFVGSAALIVLSQHDRAVDAARNALAFFRDESCGQCTPCRAGTAKAVELMASTVWDKALLDDLCRTMADASICGLGQAAPNPIRSVLRHFAHELA